MSNVGNIVIDTTEDDIKNESRTDNTNTNEAEAYLKLARQRLLNIRRRKRELHDAKESKSAKKTYQKDCQRKAERHRLEVQAVAALENGTDVEETLEADVITRYQYFAFFHRVCKLLIPDYTCVLLNIVKLHG